MAAPEVGYTDEGYSFTGGDPAKKENWLKVGEVQDGHSFLGGNPAIKENWQPIEQVEPIPQQTTIPETLVQKFGQAASFGYLPQIQAAVEPAIQAGLGMFLPEEPKGFNIQEAPSTYLQRRDEAIRQQELMSKEHPYASAAGELAGGLASGVATGGALGKALGIGGRAATFGGRLKQAAATGAAIGAVRNPGDIQGEIAPVQPVERLKNVASDAIVGAAFQGGLEGIGKVGTALKNAPDTLKSFSQIKALKASGAMLKDFRKAFGNDRANQIGQAAIDEGIIAIGDDIADIARKSDIVKEEIGQKIGSVYDAADKVLGRNPENLPFDVRSLAENLKNKLIQKYTGKAGGSSIVSKMSTILDEISVNDRADFSKMREIRQSVDDLINYSKANNEMTQIQSELRNLRTDINNQVKEGLKLVDETTGNKLLSEFEKQNKRFTNVAEISKIANDKTARETSNAVFGLRERMASGAGAVVGGMVGQGIGGPVGAAVGAGIGAGLNTITTKIARNYGTPFVAITANKIADRLKQNPQALGAFSNGLIKAAEISPKEFVTTVNLMMKKPEFKKMLENNNEQTKFSRGNQ